MSLIHDALRAGHAPADAERHGHAPRVLVAGGAGVLGSALLEQLLATRLFSQVSVIVTRPLQAASSGLAAVHWDELALHAHDNIAVVVFDRARAANGREEAFFKPQPEALPELASRLQARGVRHLLVVMPHAPSSLPHALKRGLANLDEQAVAQLGFEHLVFMRSAQSSSAMRAAHPAQRLANWMLSQLQMMVPQRERPVQARKVAQFAAQVAAHLPGMPPGTRVVPPEWVWQAAQVHDAAPLARQWLSGQPLPEMQKPSSRR